MTPDRNDYFDAYFAKLGVQKPTISEFATALQEAGYQFAIQAGGLFILNPIPQTDDEAERLREVSERFPLAMFSASEIRRFIMFGTDTAVAGPVDLHAIFAGAIAASTRHTRMEALYDALAHLSDSLSGLVSRPRLGEEGPGAEALEALDDFVMDQLDAVKNRALAVAPTDWTDQDAKIALLMKHVARFRTDTNEMLNILPMIIEELAAADTVN